MAEFLIYNKEHWMDKLTEAEVTNRGFRHKSFGEKYTARTQKGDIIEVRPDGFFTGPKAHGFNKSAFRVAVVKGMKPDKVFMQPLTKIQGDKSNFTVSILKKRRYALNIPGTEKVVNMQEFIPVEKS